MTFGAPMVVHSDAPDRLFRQLAKMERWAEASGGAAAPQLQFHNLVNNADVVPRLLGTSLDMLHAVMESYVPLIKASVTPLLHFAHLQHFLQHGVAAMLCHMLPEWEHMGDCKTVECQRVWIDI